MPPRWASPFCARAGCLADALLQGRRCWEPSGKAPVRQQRREPGPLLLIFALHLVMLNFWRFTVGRKKKRS